MAQRRKFSKEFKLEALGKVLEGDRPVGEIARELGIRPALLSRWKGEYLAESPQGTAPQVPPETELKRLRQEVVRLRQERDFLKKAVGFFAQNED
jgi:transposase